jgi:mRNA-degrading endonuclease RelE of RelBE toxin-antitoxin system
MRHLERTERFRKLFKRLPVTLRKKVIRQLRVLAGDIRQPSLNAKKMRGRQGIWEARIDYRHRVTFQIVGDRIVLRAVGPHDVLKNP